MSLLKAVPHFHLHEVSRKQLFGIFLNYPKMNTLSLGFGVLFCLLVITQSHATQITVSGIAKSSSGRSPTFLYHQVVFENGTIAAGPAATADGTFNLTFQASPNTTYMFAAAGLEYPIPTVYTDTDGNQWTTNSTQGWMTNSIQFNTSNVPQGEFRIDEACLIILEAYKEDGSRLSAYDFTTSTGTYMTNPDTDWVTSNFNHLTALKVDFYRTDYANRVSDNFFTLTFVMPLDAKRRLHTPIEIDGLGKMVLMADNNGTFFNCTSFKGARVIELNVEVAKTQLYKLQKNYASYIAGSSPYVEYSYTFSSQIQSRISAASSFLQQALQLTNRTQRALKANRATTEAVYGLEELELERAQQDIEFYRKGSVSIQVKDQNGVPLPDANVTIQQISRDFRFGFVANTDDSIKPRILTMRDAGMNMATVIYGWNNFEVSPGVYLNMNQRNASWLKEQGLQTYTHQLFYTISEVLPAYVLNISAWEDQKTEIVRHVRDLCLNITGTVNDGLVFEITNEINLAGRRMNRDLSLILGLHIDIQQAIWNATKTQNYSIFHPETTVGASLEYYGETNVADYVIANHKLNNETSGLSDMEYFQKLKDMGLNYTIAIQMYNGGVSDFNVYYGIDPNGWQVVTTYDLSMNSYLMDKISTIGLPFIVPEQMVSGWMNPSWPSWVLRDMGYWHYPWNETTQSDYLASFYQITFSKKMCRQLTFFGLDDYYQYPFLEKGGLLDTSGNPKQVYYAVKNLLSSWWTNSTTQFSNQTGQTQFKGFGGNYQVTVTYNSTTVTQTVHITEQKQTTVAISLPNVTAPSPVPSASSSPESDLSCGASIPVFYSMVGMAWMLLRV